MKKNLIDILIIFRYFSLLVSEMLDFFVEIFAKISFVIRYNNINLNDNKERRKLNVSINDKCSKLVIVST